MGFVPITCTFCAAPLGGWTDGQVFPKYEGEWQALAAIFRQHLGGDEATRKALDHLYDEWALTLFGTVGNRLMEDGTGGLMVFKEDGKTVQDVIMGCMLDWGKRDNDNAIRLFGFPTHGRCYHIIWSILSPLCHHDLEIHTPLSSLGNFYNTAFESSDIAQLDTEILARRRFCDFLMNGWIKHEQQKNLRMILSSQIDLGGRGKMRDLMDGQVWDRSDPTLAYVLANPSISMLPDPKTFADSDVEDGAEIYEAGGLLGKVPVEILAASFGWLDVRDLVALELVSRGVRNVIKGRIMMGQWRRLAIWNGWLAKSEMVSDFVYKEANPDTQEEQGNGEEEEDEEDEDDEEIAHIDVKGVKEVVYWDSAASHQIFSTINWRSYFHACAVNPSAKNRLRILNVGRQLAERFAKGEKGPEKEFEVMMLPRFIIVFLAAAAHLAVSGPVSLQNRQAWDDFANFDKNGNASSAFIQNDFKGNFPRALSPQLASIVKQTDPLIVYYLAQIEHLKFTFYTFTRQNSLSVYGRRFKLSFDSTERFVKPSLFWDVIISPGKLVVSVYLLPKPEGSAASATPIGFGYSKPLLPGADTIVHEGQKIPAPSLGIWSPTQFFGHPIFCNFQIGLIQHRTLALAIQNSPSATDNSTAASMPEWPFHDTVVEPATSFSTSQKETGGFGGTNYFPETTQLFVGDGNVSIPLAIAAAISEQKVAVACPLPSALVDDPSVNFAMLYMVGDDGDVPIDGVGITTAGGGFGVPASNQSQIMAGPQLMHIYRP
ncbi:hypothetical protein HDU97_007224 [Phlyctochytrium planicorne]|nr:hypothetical protein HDU97_007224 [Phlyctochytrium planicorne]